VEWFKLVSFKILVGEPSFFKF